MATMANQEEAASYVSKSSKNKYYTSFNLGQIYNEDFILFLPNIVPTETMETIDPARSRFLLKL